MNPSIHAHVVMHHPVLAHVAIALTMALLVLLVTAMIGLGIEMFTYRQPRYSRFATPFLVGVTLAGAIAGLFWAPLSWWEDIHDPATKTYQNAVAQAIDDQLHVQVDRDSVTRPPGHTATLTMVVHYGNTVAGVPGTNGHNCTFHQGTTTGTSTAADVTGVVQCDADQHVLTVQN